MARSLKKKARSVKTRASAKSTAGRDTRDPAKTITARDAREAGKTTTARDTDAPAAPPALHELEAEVMDEVWQQGETTVKLVMESLNRKARSPRAYTTYMTVMRRLDEKGLLARTRSGRHDTYVPRLTREQYQQRRAGAEVLGLIDEFGDVALAHFARSLSTLDPARRRQLQRLAKTDSAPSKNLDGS